jgi:hypothetical protein
LLIIRINKVKKFIFKVGAVAVEGLVVEQHDAGRDLGWFGLIVAAVAVASLAGMGPIKYSVRNQSNVRKKQIEQGSQG